jgi:hypothetical protein
MSIAAPPKALIENYMIEIAKTYKVPFEPDLAVLNVSGRNVSDSLHNFMFYNFAGCRT